MTTKHKCCSLAERTACSLFVDVYKVRESLCALGRCYGTWTSHNNNNNNIILFVCYFVYIIVNFGQRKVLQTVTVSYVQT